MDELMVHVVPLYGRFILKRKPTLAFGEKAGLTPENF
jgi:hypothetical protein